MAAMMLDARLGLGVAEGRPQLSRVEPVSGCHFANERLHIRPVG